MTACHGSTDRAPTTDQHRCASLTGRRRRHISQQEWLEAATPVHVDRAFLELPIETSPFHRHHLLKAMSLRYEGKPTADLIPCRHSTSWGSSGSNGYGRLPAGFVRLWSQLPNDDNFDDNGDDCGPLNYAPYSPKMYLSCLVRVTARSWQCGGQGFESH